VHTGDALRTRTVSVSVRSALTGLSASCPTGRFR